MRYLFLILFTFTLNTSFSQHSKMMDALKQKKFKEAINIGLELLKDDSTDATTYVGLVKCYSAINNNEEALKFSYKGLKYANKDWQFSWLYIDMFKCYYLIGKRDSSYKYYEVANTIKGTDNSNKTLKFSGYLFGFDKYYKNWTIIESENIIYYFQDTSKIEDINRYINKRDKAYTEIKKVFDVELPKKVDFFVWQDKAKAREILGRKLGFTNSTNCVSHNRVYQTYGHELTHSFTYWYGGKTSTTRFINEGAAVFFDQTNKNRIGFAKKVAKNKMINVKDIWLNGSNYNEGMLYPIAGAFAEHLYNYDKNKYLELIKNQNYENGKKIYGDKLNELITNFNKKLNTK